MAANSCRLVSSQRTGACPRWGFQDHPAAAGSASRLRSRPVHVSPRSMAGERACNPKLSSKPFPSGTPCSPKTLSAPSMSKNSGSAEILLVSRPLVDCQLANVEAVVVPHTPTLRRTAAGKQIVVVADKAGLATSGHADERTHIGLHNVAPQLGPSRYQ